MKTLLTLIALVICMPAAHADDFGPMFSGTSAIALGGDPMMMGDDDMARMLQSIEPAAGGHDDNMRVNTTGTVEIRSNEMIQEIKRSHPEPAQTR